MDDYCDETPLADENGALLGAGQEGEEREERASPGAPGPGEQQADSDHPDLPAVPPSGEFRCSPCGTGPMIDGDLDFEPLRRPANPVRPPGAVVEEHRLCHWPYRSWCDECVRGRGLGDQHRINPRPHDIPIIGVDFWYITKGTILKRGELEHPKIPDGDTEVTTARREGRLVKCLIIRCYATKNIFGHVVPVREDEDELVKNWICSAAAWLGHSRILLKSDGEPYLVSIVKRALETINCEVKDVESAGIERSHPYDSKSNGATEIGVKIIRGMHRTLRLCLERRIGREVPPDHPLAAWLPGAAVPASWGEGGLTSE